MAFENNAEQYKPREAQQISTAALLPSNSDYQNFFKPTTKTGAEPTFLDFGNANIYGDNSTKLAQDLQFPIMPNLVPSPEQVSITKETTIMAAEIASKLGTALSKDHPLAGQEEALMNATTANDPKAWENAAASFPQLGNISTGLMKAYVRNELAFYGPDDLGQDIAARGGIDPNFHHFTLGMAQITSIGVKEFEHRYPQLKQFLESKGYGPGHEAQALLDPECVPMIVAAKTASIIDDLRKHGIEHPTSEQIAYEYNPDVYSHSEGGHREYKTIYGDLKIAMSKALHHDQKKEYYPNDPNVLTNSEHVHNVMSWLRRYE